MFCVIIFSFFPYVDRKKLFDLIKKRSKDSNIMIHPGIAIFSHTIEGRDKFELLVVRSKDGVQLVEDNPPIHAFFIVVATQEQRNFYMHSLMWMVQIAEQIDFNDEWMNVKGVEELRNIILQAWKNRKI